MRTRTVCIYCGEAGMVRRELTIHGSKMVIANHCAKCGGRWETRDQRRAPYHHDAGEARERRARPR